MNTPDYSLLFEPVKLGPVTAPNRFYQVPHCTGMGYTHPMTLASMRGIKAEGGWGVVNTEYCSIHPTSDDTPYPHCTLWDDGDVRNMAAMTERVHAHGSLAGVELWHGGRRSSNLHSRHAPLGAESLPTTNDPWQSQRMDLADIRAFREWHKAAARRAVQAGFDIVYIYAAHTYLVAQFLDRFENSRNHEYGGDLMENRARLLHELLHDTCEATNGKCALAVRIEVDNEDGSDTGRNELLQSIAPLVDLFDVTVSDYSQEMGVSRFVEAASFEDRVGHVKRLTGKPVVGVGRFTSPDAMISQVRRGVLDLIGAARPSIADPFLPAKIRDGRLDEIRECIGCNICYAGDGQGVPVRCTQNPTMGEEWRRGWHPEKAPVSRSKETVLVVGSGPAGLEAAHILSKRGYQVMLAEADKELGGRVVREATLPGLAEWIRVRDYRLQHLTRSPAVSLYPASNMTAADIGEAGADHVIVATGSHWRGDGRGRTSTGPIEGMHGTDVFTPDDILSGRKPQGPVTVYDDDNYYMASALAEKLALDGHTVTYITPSARVSDWSTLTTEQFQVHKRLAGLGVTVRLNTTITSLSADALHLTCSYTGEASELPRTSIIAVTSREPNESLWLELVGKPYVQRIGDCRAPGIIAQAVYDGHRAARELGNSPDEVLVKRERVCL
jgi:dimethylamine/trimethylamine dehydrogenase